MDNEHVLTGLIRKRVEIAGEVEEAKSNRNSVRSGGFFISHNMT
jgi:hypothetical protein